MLTRSKGHGFYDPPGEMNRLSEQRFGAIMAPAEGTRQVPIAVRA